jgi:integron integrase
MIKISTDASGRITVQFSYSPRVVQTIKTIKTRRWEPDDKCWSFPHSPTILDEILSTLSGEELQIDPSLQQEASISPGNSSTKLSTRRDKPTPTDQLLERVRHLIRLKHYSIRTEKSYLPWITQYLAFHHNRDPNEMGGREIEAFLSHLAVDRKVSSSTQNQAFNALLFLYREVLKKQLDESINAVRAKKPQHLPTVMTKDEVMRVISATSPEHQLMVKLIYGSGLRLMECLRLRVKDVDFGNNQILVRDAKGMKDRVTVLPENLKTQLREHLERVWLLHEDDLSQGHGNVYLPYALEKKYPNASREFGWQYVFPAKTLSKDPRIGEVRRHHVHEHNLQKAVRDASCLAGMDKRVSVQSSASFFCYAPIGREV